MEYRPLGKTGLRVSALSFGASPLGSVFAPIIEAEGVKAVHRAIELGVNLFDVSPYYGITRAETVLGQALQGKRQQVILATKAGRINTDEFDFSKAAIKKSLEASLQRLHTDYVDILQLHDIEFGHPAQVLGEGYEALQELRTEGKCRFIGMTAYPLHVLRRAIQQCDLDVVLSYCHFYLANTLLLTELLTCAREKQVGIINASITGMGLLTPQGPPDWHPSPPQLRACCRQAVVYCQENGVDIVDLCLQYTYANSDIASTLVGMSKASHVERNLAAIEHKPDPELLSEALRILQPAHNTTWPSGLNWQETEEKPCGGA